MAPSLGPVARAAQGASSPPEGVPMAGPARRAYNRGVPTHRRRAEVPEIPRTPARLTVARLVRDLPRLMRSPFEVFAEWHRRYGDVVRIPFGHPPHPAPVFSG